MIKYFKILILILLLYSYANAQDGIDSCSIQAERIIKTWERLKPKFEEFAVSNLQNFIIQDSILKNHFLTGDSSNYKKLEMQINPIMKLGYEARNFKTGEDICKYFVFDTINYDCFATFYLNDSLIFYITRGHNDCDKEFLCPGGCPGYNWCKDKLTFIQYFYKNVKLNECHIPDFHYKIYKNPKFIFVVDGLDFFKFTINENKINIHPPENVTDIADYRMLRNYDKPNLYITTFYKEKDIHSYSKMCCPGCIPWWRFWDRFLHLKYKY